MSSILPFNLRQDSSVSNGLRPSFAAETSRNPAFLLEFDLACGVGAVVRTVATVSADAHDIIFD